MKIAFIGLGRMGSAMARNILRAGHDVVVYNRTREKADALAGDGAKVAGSPAEACGSAEAVLTMLSDDAGVEATVFGERGIATALGEDCVHISHSTISTSLARRLSAEHASRGQRYLSVPVFGRPEAADAKRLLVVAAGPGEIIDRCRPLFEAIGRQTVVAGPEPWQANAVKLCGNFMIASVLETFGEAFATVRKSGIDPHVFLEVMTSLFASPVYTGYGRIIAEEQFDPAGFALKLGLKDIRLVLAASEEAASPMPLASLIRDHFISAIAQGHAELDWSAIARVCARNAGL